MDNSEDEIWKDIPNYEGLYQASNFGRIKSLFRQEITIHPRSRKTMFRKRREKILDMKLDKDGYFKVRPCKNGKARTFFVHRLILLAFVPNPNSLPQINHKDGNKINNNINNLEWCNSSQNMLHSYVNHLHKIENKRGESSSVSILKEKEVLEIRRLWDSNLYTQKDLASKFKTEQSNISRIVNKIYWSHI